MHPSLWFAALAAVAVNADEKSIYVSDGTTVPETVPVAHQAQIKYQATPLSAVIVDCECSNLSKQSTVMVPESITSYVPTLEVASATSTPPPASIISAGEVPAAAGLMSYWSTAWTFTIEPESTPSASPTLAIATSVAATATACNAYQQAVLYNHNIHRSNHSAPYVEWSVDLETSAHALAAKCVYKHDT